MSHGFDHRALLARRLRALGAGAVLLGLAACDSDPAPADGAGAPDASGATAATDDQSTEDLETLKDRAPFGRLPEGVAPTAYDVAMTIDPREDRFSGTVTISVSMDEAQNGLWLHGNGLSVSQVLVEAGDGAPRPGSYTQVLPTGVSWVGFGEMLPAGEVSVTIVYDAPFDKNLAGLFRVEEQGEAYALAKSESIQARKFLPSFDEPGLKAPFTVSLRIPDGYEAIANTPERTRGPVEDGLVRIFFAPTRPLSTFLLSLAVGPFDRVDHPALPATQIRDREIPLRGFARKGRGQDLKLVLDITRDFVEIFEEALGIPYPYKKLDIVAAPQWPSGATELAGAITYREQRILVGDDPAPGVRRALLSVHAHELAHMWFGNLVTPPWWDDLWLKEGFATWGTPLVLEQWEPDGGHGLDATARALGAMDQDVLASVRAVREPVLENATIRNAYTAIPYSKGMALIRMVETAFGAETFRRALGRYIKTHEDGAADSDQFFETIGTVTGEPALTAAFRSFVDQKGVPLIEAALDCSGEAPAVSLRQSRFRPLGSDVPTGTRWTIPLCVGYPEAEGVETACTILETETASLPLGTAACPGWILPNAGGTGYYRWSVTDDGWSALTEAFPALTPAEQLVTVDSAVAGHGAGTVPPAAVRAVMAAAAQAPTRRVAVAPVGTLARAVRILGDNPQADRIRTFARDLYGARLMAARESGDPDSRLLASTLETFLALTARDQALRAELAEAAGRFIGLGGEPDTSALTADQYAAALTVGLQEGGSDFLEALIGARVWNDDPRFDGASATALGRVNDPILAVQIRDYALSGTPGPREAYAMFAGLMDGTETREETWAWLKINIDAVTAAIPAQWRRRLPTLTDGFCDPARSDEIEAFFDAHAQAVPGYKRQLSQTLERLALCAARRDHLIARPLIE
ncbi:MAG: M1 family metallopeptidase [Alphaproteobacteria bacterium]